ncbi:hypothetical protein PHYC_03777 [Phycisphaerales bacterium]|nr:hypothetical protein PHYC_03777 [Phycisphaerales bacterium]
MTISARIRFGVKSNWMNPGWGLVGPVSDTWGMPTVVEKATDLVIAGRYAQAEGLLRPHVARRTDDAAAAYLLGHSLVQLGKPRQALFYLERAASPACAPVNALLEYAGALFDCGSHQEGIRQAERAAKAFPGVERAHTILAKMLLRGGLFVDAMERSLRAMSLDAAAPEPVSVYASCLMGLGRTEQSVEWFRKAAVMRPGDPQLQANLCFALNSDASSEPRVVLQEHLAYGRLVGALAGRPTDIPAAFDGVRRIRVGFLSADLREHPVARFMLPLLRHLDRDGFELVCYAATLEPDAMTARLQQLVPAWHDAAAMDDASLAAAIRRDRVDVLIELSGLTGNTRAGALAHRAAPVQMTYLGYPNTTGIPGVDFRIVDKVTDPTGAERFASEGLVRLPGCFVCFPDLEGAPPVASAREGPVVFGSFNNPTKITDATLGLWRRVLDRVPGSRLALKGKGFADDKSRRAFERRFTGAGIDLARTDMLAYTRSHAEHLGSYSAIDIALDTYPYAGTTTTCEALWMGVPVVTLAGRTHASRVGASLLRAAGLEDWTTESPDRYAEVAAGLGADRPALAAIRAGLRDRVASSALCDGAAFARAFESAVRECLRVAR